MTRGRILLSCFALSLLCGVARAEKPVIVVLDAGHGGVNRGAASVRRGFYEKNLTLFLAKSLQTVLEKRGVTVIMTRTTDEYLTLRQRSKLANSARADLFLSLHCNATDLHNQLGFETWIASNSAIDVDSRALRQKDGPARPEVSPDIAFMLDDVERGFAQKKAAQVAAIIHKHLRGTRGIDADRGVQQASKDVLLGATMPAILVEVGFIDHPIEGNEMLEPATQGKIVSALADAVTEALPLVRQN